MATGQKCGVAIRESSVVNLPPMRARATPDDNADPEQPVVQIPVNCPVCGTERLAEFPVAVVAIALTRWNNMRLQTTCHDVAWDATPRDLQRIRGYLGSQWLDDHRP